MDARIGDQVGLEFGQVNVQSAIEAQRSRNGRDNLADQAVQVGVGWALDIQVAATNIIDSFVIDHESAVGMFQGGMGGQDGVVGFDDGSRDLGSRVDGKFQLRLLAIVDRKAFHQQGSETRASTTTKGMEDEESLKASALVRELADTIQHQVNNFLSNGVVSTSIVIGSIFFASNKLLRVEQLPVGTSANFINYSWLQVNKDSTRNMLARTYIRKFMLTKS